MRIADATIAGVTVREILELLSVVTAVIAIAAFTLAIVDLEGSAAGVRTSRQDSARDSCQLLRGLVYAATNGNPDGRTAANAYIHRTSLRDCNSYARKIVH